MSKKILIISILLIMSLLFANAYADENAALDIVKSKIDIPEGYSVFKSAVAEGNTYKYWWSTPLDMENGGEISVTADNNGNILSYYHFKNNYVNKDEGARFSNYNKSDSRFFALRFIERVCPELADNVEYNKITLETDISKNLKTASVSFYRVENNIPYYDNYMDFVIDLNSSDVIQYTLKWDFDAQFPEVGHTLSQQAAIRQYNSRIGINLKYNLKTEDGKKKAYLVYSPINDTYAIDAYNGKTVLPKQQTDESYFDNYHSDSLMEGISFSEEEMMSLPSLEKFVSLQQAEYSARNNNKLDITDEYSLTYSSYEKIDGRYCINLEFSRLPAINFEEMTEEEKLLYMSGDYSYIRLKTDMYTGDIISINRYNKEEELLEMPMSDTVARSAADSFLKENLPAKYANCKYSATDSTIDGGIYKFVYIGYVGSVPFDGNNIEICINSLTGQIHSLKCIWNYDVIFESAGNIIDINEARNVFFSKIPFNITYVNTAEGIKPVYALYPFYPHIIGADDGIIKNEDGNNYKSKKYAVYTDIEGHYAQGMIIRLTNNFIIMGEDGKFNPDNNISQKEFLSWMTTALTGTYYENTNDMYSYLITAGVINSEEVHPDAELLKEDAVKFFVKALGYEDVAKVWEIYTLDFTDAHIITPEKTGYIAIAKAIGIVSGDENNKVLPKTPLTKGDGACMIYKYLAR